MGRIIPHNLESHKIHVPNHQPEMGETNRGLMTGGCALPLAYGGMTQVMTPKSRGYQRSSNNYLPNFDGIIPIIWIDW